MLTFLINGQKFTFNQPFEKLPQIYYILHLLIDIKEEPFSLNIRDHQSAKWIKFGTIDSTKGTVTLTANVTLSNLEKEVKRLGEEAKKYATQEVLQETNKKITVLSSKIENPEVRTAIRMVNGELQLYLLELQKKVMQEGIRRRGLVVIASKTPFLLPPGEKGWFISITMHWPFLSKEISYRGQSVNIIYLFKPTTACNIHCEYWHNLTGLLFVLADDGGRRLSKVCG